MAFETNKHVLIIIIISNSNNNNMKTWKDATIITGKKSKIPIYWSLLGRVWSVNEISQTAVHNFLTTQNQSKFKQSNAK